MRCGWGPYFRRTFEVQAGNSPLQGQSKPPAKLVVLILGISAACKDKVIRDICGEAYGELDPMNHVDLKYFLPKVHID